MTLTGFAKESKSPQGEGHLIDVVYAGIYPKYKAQRFFVYLKRAMVAGSLHSSVFLAFELKRKGVEMETSPIN